MMEVRTIFVMTHESIGVGEDGPTHQSVEQVAALRAIPHVAVYRPADAVETAECWVCVLDADRQAAVLALSRQPLPLLRADVGSENRSARGAYVLHEAEDGERALTILATGSAVQLAVEARGVLQAQGIPTTVVSMPCWLLFEQQDEAYRDQALGTAPCVAVEAQVPMGWDRYIGRKGGFVGMSDFGMSGESAEVYKHFGITTQAVVDAGHAAVRS